MDLGILKGLKDEKITADSLYGAIASAIDSKQLKRGDKLPSTRDIAMYLGISRTTVMKAFEALIGRGYLTSSQGAGTWVTPPAEPQLQETSANTESYQWSQRYSSLARNLSIQASEPIESDDFDEMNFGSSPTELVPLNAWRKIVLKLSHSMDDTAFDANKEVFGYRPLREAIVGFLRRTKGIVCEPEQIVLSSGVQSVISPVFTLLVKPGDLGVCENPGFWGAREQFHSLGADVATLPIDGEGLLVDELNNLDRPAQLIYVAPSCQEPTCVTLSEPRRHSLLSYCRKNSSFILEDDWDSEFHYGGPSAPSLFSLDKTGSVIYFYSFWRLLYPLISVGFLVIPRNLIEVFESYKNVWDREFTLLEHQALTELLNEGHVETHIRAMWKTYRKRRQSLIFALTQAFTKDVEIVPSNTGMHIVARFNSAYSEADVEQSAHKAGLPCASTAPYYAEEPRGNEFIMRFSSIPTEDIESRVREFAASLKSGVAAD